MGKGKTERFQLNLNSKDATRVGGPKTLSGDIAYRHVEGQLYGSDTKTDISNLEGTAKDVIHGIVKGAGRSYKSKSTSGGGVGKGGKSVPSARSTYFSGLKADIKTAADAHQAAKNKKKKK